MLGALEAVDTLAFYATLYERLSLSRYARTSPLIYVPYQGTTMAKSPLKRPFIARYSQGINMSR